MEAAVPNRKRVCFVSLEVHPTTHGGAGIFLSHTVSRLLSDGFEVLLLLAISDDEFRRFCDIDRLTFPSSERLLPFQVSALARDSDERPRNGVDAVWALSVDICFALKKLTDLYAIDLIEFYDYCGPAWHSLAEPRLIDQKIAVRLHSTIELIERRVRQRADAVRAPHFHQERDQIRLADALFYSGQKFYEQEVRNIYPFLDGERAQPSPPCLLAPARVEIYSGARDVLFYGRLSTLKGLDTFLRGISIAFKDTNFREWLNRIIIAGPEETVATNLTLHEMMSVVPDDVRDLIQFTGRVDHDQLKKYISNVAFAVFPNKIESFCYAAHEIYLMGVPLILAPLPTFYDFFQHNESALFFDGTANDLAKSIIRLSEDRNLRERLLLSGSQRRQNYQVNHYNHHIVTTTKRRLRAPASAVSVSVFIFSHGDDFAEKISLDSLINTDVRVFLLRSSSSGLNVGGNFFARIDANGSETSDLDFVGDAIIGLRAGDRLLVSWLDDARTLMASDPKVGAVSCWLVDNGGVKTSADNLVPELTLSAHMGLRRLIRVEPGQVFAELIGLMKNSGETGLLLKARADGLALLESPRAGVDIREATVTPQVNVDLALRSEYDLFDKRFFAMQGDLTAKNDDQAVVWRGGSVSSPFEALNSALDQNLCLIRSRPDIDAGELWVSKPYAGPGRLRMSWAEMSFTGIWNAHGHPNQAIEGYGTSCGSVSFSASEDGTICLMQGPTCGACQITLGKLSIVLNLRHSDYGDVLVRLSDLTVIDDTKLTVTTRSDSALRIWLFQNLRQSNERSLLMIARRNRWLSNDASISADALLDTAELNAMTASVRETSSCLGAWLKAEPYSKVVVEICRDEDIELIDSLWAAGFGDRAAAALVPDAEAFRGQSGYTAQMLATAALHAAVRRRGKRVTIFTSDESQLNGFANYASSVALLRAVPAPSNLNENARGTPTIAIVGASTLTAVRTHLVAAAMLVRHELGNIRLLIPSDDVQGVALLKEFNLAPTVFYNDIADLAHAAIGPSVALCVYPDRTLPAAANVVASLGFLPLVGPAGLGTNAADIKSRFVVSYWEDSLAIAKAAITLVKTWPEACSLYRTAEKEVSLIAAEAAAENWRSSMAAVDNILCGEQ